MGDPAQMITVSIEDANGNSITPQPLTVKPPVETDKLIKRLQGGHGAGVLLRGHNDLVMDDTLEQPGPYTYRVTGGGTGLGSGAGASGSGSGGGSGGTTEAKLLPVLDRLETVTSQLCQVALETKSQTRPASKISALDLRRFQAAAGVEVIGTAAAISFVDLKGKLPEADGFEWDERAEPQQVDRYMPFWVEQLKQTAERLQRPWPEGMLQAHWRNMCGMAVIQFHHSRCSFPLSSKNDVALYFTGLHTDAVLGVELKKKLDDQSLREAEVEFYTWDSCVAGPFLQVVTDLCRGGAAFWCEAVKEPAAMGISNSIIRCHLLASMCEVYEFVTKAIHSIPDHVVKAQGWPPGPRVLKEPQRVKFFNPAMMTIPEELEAQGAEPSEGGGPIGRPDSSSSGGTPHDEAPPKLHGSSSVRSSKGGRSSKGADARCHGAMSPERSRQLVRFLERLRADADDVANLRDVADVA